MSAAIAAFVKEHTSGFARMWLPDRSDSFFFFGLLFSLFGRGAICVCPAGVAWSLAVRCTLLRLFPRPNRVSHASGSTRMPCFALCSTRGTPTRRPKPALRPATVLAVRHPVHSRSPRWKCATQQGKIEATHAKYPDKKYTLEGGGFRVMHETSTNAIEDMIRLKDLKEATLMWVQRAASGGVWLFSDPVLWRVPLPLPASQGASCGAAVASPGLT